MKARVQAHLLCPTGADAITVRDYIATKLALKLKYATDTAPVAFLNTDGNWTVACDVRFELRLDADELFADLQDKWKTGTLKNLIRAGSRATFHVCPHDENPDAWADCRSASFEYAEAAK